MSRILPRILLLLGTAFLLTGCLIETETAITPDPVVDPRLAGIWQIAPKLPDEIRGERDRDVWMAGVNLIIAPLQNPHGPNDKSVYKALSIEDFSSDTETGSFPEMLVSTRKHQGRDLMLIRLPEYEKAKARAKAEPGQKLLHNLVLDYEFDRDGELFLRFLFLEDIDEILKAHPIEAERPKGDFAPITLKGDEKALLDLYTDPRVRALLTSLGKYQKLEPRKP